MVCYRVKKKFRHWSELEKWQPSLDEIQQITNDITHQFATSKAAKAAQEAENDDYLAHLIYFI